MLLGKRCFSRRLPVPMRAGMSTRVKQSLAAAAAQLVTRVPLIAGVVAAAQNVPGSSR